MIAGRCGDPANGRLQVAVRQVAAVFQGFQSLSVQYLLADMSVFYLTSLTYVLTYLILPTHTRALTLSIDLGAVVEKPYAVTSCRPPHYAPKREMGSCARGFQRTLV